MAKCTAVVARTACVGNVGRFHRIPRTVKRVQRNEQRIKKQAINANVSLVDVRSVQKRTKEKEFFVRRAKEKRENIPKIDTSASVILTNVVTVKFRAKEKEFVAIRVQRPIERV